MRLTIRNQAKIFISRTSPLCSGIGQNEPIFLSNKFTQTNELLATSYLSTMDRYITMQSTERGEIKVTQSSYSRLIRFLQDDLSISAASLAVALRHSEQDPGPLPMILWQYGLVTLEQLEQIYDWLETA